MDKGNNDFSKLLARVNKELKKSPKNKTELVNFANYFFAHGNASDFLEYEPRDIAAIVRSAFEFRHKRQPGRSKIRIFNPELKRDGWRDPHTVIEILNDDMPFLVDSVLDELAESSTSIFLLLHPVEKIKRQVKSGTISSTDKGSNVARESFIHIHIERISSASERAELMKRLEIVLKEIRLVVIDWQAMMDRVRKVIDEYKEVPPPIPVDELAECLEFLNRLVDGHFIFLGIRQYAFEGKAGTGNLVAVKNSSLGILRDSKVEVLRRAGKLVSMTPEVRDFLQDPAPLIIAKANVKANVHRRVHMDYIGVKIFDAKGRLKGELRLIGLFTSAAYTSSVKAIPILRRKAARVLEASGVNPEGHSGKALESILENYPRDELFQIDEETLAQNALGMLRLSERPRTAIFVRKDKFDRYVSALVFVPRERFNTDVRVKIGNFLAHAYDGRISAHYISYPEGTLTRIHYIIGRNEDETPSPDTADLEITIEGLTRSWSDNLVAAIKTRNGGSVARGLIERYADAFSPAYQDAFSPTQGLADITRMENLDHIGGLSIEFGTNAEASEDYSVRLKLYHSGGPIALSDRLPILEKMDFRAINERSYQITRGEGGTSDDVWVHDIILQHADGKNIYLAKLEDRLEACFMAVWNGLAENDGYNALVLNQGFGWRDVAMLRTYGKYLRQVGVSFSQTYMAATLVNHGTIATWLVELFHTRFDTRLRPGKTYNTAREKALLAKIEEALGKVSSLDEDRIIRHFSNVIMTTLRTNFFQTGKDGQPKPSIAVKLNSRLVDGLPEPRPYAEIFVYSPDVEGIHMRFGKIARGGLRWSDRPEDFRTEVLGLVKAQQVKNAVIVPVGSKGGFVPKKLPHGGSRALIQEEAIRCYKLFITSLLDLTDNLAGDKLIPPQEVIRHDDDDPYLVVAADKGTATFSDIANSISEAKGFWLGDAFASGGSAGYDHKKMGITARGGWEAVKRHFREMNIDCQTTPFTVIGVGDMSGDVFGNGMLLSPQTKVIAAFDHRDIFIDPDPDPAQSFAERKRLFAMDRSSWQDYARALISDGGGIFSRSEKSIALSDEICAMTGLKSKSVTPNELLHALLKSKADLLWFGGIGTYIRATSENDSDVGDRANDSIRVTAKELKFRIIGEGANLGMTQKARIEFAQNGGRMNTDAIDNSAGVNSSDVEVNIKIALGTIEAANQLTRKNRNKFLAKMTKQVASLVLRNNIQQTLSLSLAEFRGMEEIGFQQRLMRSLEKRNLLDREVEFLPSDAEIHERQAAGHALTRPELSVLLAYAKIVLYDDLLATEVPDDSYLGAELIRYFPELLQKTYPNAIQGHKLRREIIATMLANSIVNRGGPTIISRLIDETGADVADIAAAFAIARDCFALTDLNAQIDALDNKINTEEQTRLYVMAQTLMRDQLVWFLRNTPTSGGLEKVIGHYRTGLVELETSLGSILPEAMNDDIKQVEKQMTAKGVPSKLAGKIAALDVLSRGPDIIYVAGRTRKKLKDVAKIFFELGTDLKIDWLTKKAAEVSSTDYYERLALNRIIDNMYDAQRSIVREILSGKVPATKAFKSWRTKNSIAYERTMLAVNETVETGDLTLAKLAVASGHLRDLVTG